MEAAQEEHAEDLPIVHIDGGGPASLDPREADLPEGHKTALPAPRSPSAKTLLVYDKDWKAFRTWCQTRELPSLPTLPGTLASYLDAGAVHFRPGTLTRHLAAIAAKHRQHGLASPIDAALRHKLRDLHRADRTRKFVVAPAAEQLLRMAACCPADLPGKRDRALLLLAAAEVRHAAGGSAMGRLNRSALIGLDVEDIRFIDAGSAISQSSASGEAGSQTSRGGAELWLRRFGRGGPRIAWLERQAMRTSCPVSALEDWLRSSHSAFGPVFRKIDRWGNLEHRRLGTDAIRRIWRRRMPGPTRTTAKRSKPA